MFSSKGFLILTMY